MIYDEDLIVLISWIKNKRIEDMKAEIPDPSKKDGIVPVKGTKNPVVKSTRLITNREAERKRKLGMGNFNAVTPFKYSM
ncbi:hypothetical protein [Paenibacillus periandrae]|uniref:hypothetical protein n=1 Tax=Paenibacillus periandrae TaxID=1761741 RepID=UPI001F091D17|nr:hypothetical protein [Paenibacillus periandrae]